MGKNEDNQTAQENQPAVDMGKIVSMMGPVPFGDGKANASTESSETPGDLIGPTSAPELPEEVKDVDKAVEDVNKELEAMTEGLGIKAADEDTPKFDDDEATITAVNDIVSHESDVVLEAEDKAVGITEKDRAQHSFKEWLKYIWSNKKARYGIIAGLGILLLTFVALPFSRYFILNNLGVRASVNVTVLDNSTQLPLKNAKVETRGIEAMTDDQGNATLEHVKLGKARIHISKRAFADIYQDVTLGWGSNPLGQFSLKAVGSQYVVDVTDYLSGKGLEKAQASSGEGNATSDKDGKITLTLDVAGKSETDNLDVEIVLDGYRTENIKISVIAKDATKVKLVPSAQDVFISNRSGKYDIYGVDIDGKNEKKLVSGTGLERADLALVPEANTNVVAYAATRENVKNTDGYLLTTLYVFDKTEGSLSKIDQSEQIQIIGWASDHRLIYVKIAAGTSAGNNQRYRLMSFNSKNPSDNKELSSGNAFNDVVLAGKVILYAPSNYLKDTTPGLFAVNSDGSGKTTITSTDTYNIFRTDYGKVTVGVGGTFYTYNIGGAASSLAPVSAPDNTNRLYENNAAGTKSVFYESQKAKDWLSIHDITNNTDTTLVNMAGTKLPFYWLTDNIVIFRVVTGVSTADYAVSIDGGQPQKVTDLTDVEGQTRWYYY